MIKKMVNALLEILHLRTPLRTRLLREKEQFVRLAEAVRDENRNRLDEQREQLQRIYEKDRQLLTQRYLPRD